MKKALFLTAAMLFIGFGFSYAQVKPGVRVSINRSSIESEFTPDTEGGVGYDIGGYVQLPVSKRFVIEPNLLYSVRTDKMISEGITERMRFNYIDIPVLMRLYVAEGFNIYAGPGMSYNLDGKYMVEMEGVQLKTDLEDVEEVLYSIHLGMGYQFESGFNVQLNFQHDYTGSIEKVENVDPNAHIDTFHIAAGYTF